MSIELKDYKKALVEDKEFVSDVRDEDMSQQVVRRVFAVNKAFIGVSFKQTDFSHVYFRNCRFFRCNFTGSSISRSNFRGSQYEECKFQYSTWEHTILDEDFLDNCLPGEENLARDLVRSLRVNFSQIGNYQAVNKAASIEVALTGQHLFHSAYSKQSYYRAKYKGWNRLLNAVRHAKWKALDYLWGNGESLYRIVASGLFAIIACAALLVWSRSQFAWPDTIWVVAKAFWGVDGAPSVPRGYFVLLTVVRFILVGLFMAILVKRLSRR